MKKLRWPAAGLLVGIILSCGNSNSKTADLQNRTYLISMNGIDSLRLGMGKAELEKLLGTTFTLRHIPEGGATDTFPARYKNNDFVIILQEGDDSTIATLHGVSTTSAACKTANGLGVGSEKIKVIEGYPINKKFVGPVYDEYPVISQTRSVVAVTDTFQTNAIQFHIINRKVVSVEVNSYYEFY